MEHAEVARRRGQNARVAADDEGAERQPEPEQQQRPGRAAPTHGPGARHADAGGEEQQQGALEIQPAEQIERRGPHGGRRRRQAREAALVAGEKIGEPGRQRLIGEPDQRGDHAEPESLAGEAAPGARPRGAAAQAPDHPGAKRQQQEERGDAAGGDGQEVGVEVEDCYDGERGPGAPARVARGAEGERHLQRGEGQQEGVVARLLAVPDGEGQDGAEPRGDQAGARAVERGAEDVERGHVAGAGQHEGQAHAGLPAAQAAEQPGDQVDQRRGVDPLVRIGHDRVDAGQAGGARRGRLVKPEAARVEPVEAQGEPEQSQARDRNGRPGQPCPGRRSRPYLLRRRLDRR